MLRKKLVESAFTLVELLIVIGIIGVLAVTLMISLNPAEAQRKSRDVKRLKDLQTIQSIVEQAFGDGLVSGACATGIGGTACNSFSAGVVPQQQCAANFLSMNVCNYAKFIPLDPSNGRTATCRNAAATSPGCNFAYYFNSSGTDYEINVRQESASNASKLTTDGGNNNAMIEVFTSNAANGNNMVGAALNP